MLPDLSGYRFPAEFEPHTATWLLWPTRPDNWRLNAEPAQVLMRSLADSIARFEPVRLGVRPQDMANVAGTVNEAVKLVPLLFDDTWVRDTGPTVLVAPHRNPVAIDWKFNSWGGLFASAAADDAVAEKIAHHEGYPTLKAPIVLEGGAILTDGRGTLITTEECVLCNNRNPGLSKSDAEKVLKNFFQCQSVIWLPFGLANDEAGGHVDNICSFASADTLLVASTDDRSHPSFSILEDTNKILRGATNAVGHPYAIVEVPLPEQTAITAEESAGFASADGTIVRSPGRELAPSYLNLYIANGCVIVPTFNEPTSDEGALRIISRVFPTRRLIPFPSREFLLGGGAIHCLTKELPLLKESV